MLKEVAEFPGYLVSDEGFVVGKYGQVMKPKKKVRAVICRSTFPTIKL